MKKLTIIVLSLCLLAALCGCGKAARPTQAPVTAPPQTAAPEPTAESLSASYAEILRSGRYMYSFTADNDGTEVTVTVAVDGDICAVKEEAGGKGYRAVVTGEKGVAIDLATGQMREFSTADSGAVCADCSALEFIRTETEGGRVTDYYSCTMNGESAELALVFESGALTGIDSPESSSTGVCPLVEFTSAPLSELFEIPVKTTLAIDEIAEGTYAGTLSGDSWANSKGTMFTTIPSAELSVTVQDGQVTLYCEAQASADGEIDGVAAPHSPEFTVIVSGSLPLAQSSDTVVSAEGDVSMLGESLSILYDDGKFTRWEVKERSSDSTYYCTVSITLVNGIPVAEITVDGNLSHQTATVPLSLAA